MRGPTKKLAPTISPDQCCPHEWTEDDGLQLEIDCSSCPGGNSLANPKCFSGILKALSAGGVPDAIVLKSYLHKRYRGDAVSSAASVAAELSTIDRALILTSLERPSDKRCRTCQASSGVLMTLLRRSILTDPVSYAADRAGFAARIREELPYPDCERAHECVDKGLSLMVQARS